MGPPNLRCKEIVIICIKQDVEILSNSSFFFCKSRTSKIRYLGNDQQATASSDVRLTQTSLCLMTATSHCCLKCRKIRCINNQPPIDLPPKKISQNYPWGTPNHLGYRNTGKDDNPAQDPPSGTQMVQAPMHRLPRTWA